MATLKVYLDKNESEDDFKANLTKALTLSTPEAQHESDKFHDPAAEDILEKMLVAHYKMLSDVLAEIANVL